MSQTFSTIKFIIQSVIVGLAIGFLFVFFKPDLLNTDNSEKITKTEYAPRSYATAVKKVTPSVVSIYAQTQVYRDPRLSPKSQNQSGLSSLNNSTSITEQYLGSGVVVSENGYIVTNYHVVAKATKVIVSLWDNSLLEAKIIGSDKVTDIAVLKIEALNLTPAVFADSDHTETGDIVMAIGNPYGLSQSVTLGIVSAKGRSGLSVSTIENFIQTDAAINEGNSGGALINAEGDVVGISTATFNQNGAQGINFAIPANATKLIMQEILDHGKVLRGWLGIYLITDHQFYNSRGYLNKPRQGVVVLNIHKNFPAQNAGFKQFDIITHIDDTELIDQRHYEEIIARSKPGQTLELSGYSDGKPYRKKIITVERPFQLK